MVTVNSTRKTPLLYVLVYFIIWILLFEFILPVNNILPRPSIVIESFGDLWKDYKLPANYLSTIFSIYIPLMVSYFLIHHSGYLFIRGKSFLSDFIHSLNWYSKFLPGILIGMMLIYWFPESVYIESFFVLFTSVFSLIIFLQKTAGNIPEEYLDSARSLGLSERVINRNVAWKYLQPQIFDHLLVLHLYIWPMIIAFEYIKNGYGLGTIFRLALEYRDLSALFSVFIITGLTIYEGKSVIKFLKTKYAFWG